MKLAIRSSIVALGLLVSFNIQAAYENACFWEGEEYLKTSILDNHESWVNAVQDLFVNGEDVKTDFEGIGSCRFLPASLGPDLKTALINYESSYKSLIPTTAYLNVTGATVKLVVPSATFGAGTTLVTFNKDFYSSNVSQCTEQKENVLEAGKQSAGLSQLDVTVKDNKMGGIAAVITPSLTTTNFYGLCNFHPAK